MQGLFTGETIQIGKSRHYGLGAVISFLEQGNGLCHPVLFPNFRMQIQRILVFFHFSYLLLFFPSFSFVLIPHIVYNLTLDESFQVPHRNPHQPDTGFFRGPGDMRRNEAVLRRQQGVGILGSSEESTSSPAAAITPLFSASARSFSFTKGPRRYLSEWPSVS